MVSSSSSPGGLLILGGSGFLGSHLLRRAPVVSGAPVVAASRNPKSYRLPGTPAEIVERVFDAEHDDPVALFDQLQPACVILTTAHSRVADCEREPERAHQLNTVFPGRVAEWCSAQATRLVHVSTDLVFSGAAPPGGYREEDEPGAPNVYGRTKAAGEERVLAANPAALIVRLPLLFGDSCGRGLGASDALRAPIRRGEKPGLFLDEWRTALECENAADALLEAAMARSLAGILHVAGPARLSRLELGLLMLEAMGSSAEEAHARVRPIRRADVGMQDRASDCSLATGRARSVLETRLDPPGLRPLPPALT